MSSDERTDWETEIKVINLLRKITVNKVDLLDESKIAVN